jgi:hypothetical protein
MSTRHYAGIFFLSAATLLLELALMRVLSVAIWYHFGFLVISMALLAFGTSGVVLTLMERWRQRLSLDHALAVLSLAFGGVAIASYSVLQFVAFNPFDLLIDHRQLLFIPLYYLLAGAPFFCSGLAIGLLLSRGGKSVHRLYAADLIGAGLGCAAIAVVTPLFGGAGSIVIAAGLGFIAAAVFAAAGARRYAVSGVVLAILSIPMATVADRAIPISISSDKHHPLLPTDRAPLYTAWNAFSRVDVYDLPASPQSGRPDPGYSLIIDGGAAGTAVPAMSAGVERYLADAKGYHATGIGYVGKPHANVLIIGSGAGREVLEAVAYGARSVTAVEINPIITDIVSQRMRPELGGLFDLPQVHLVTEEGRSFLRRSKDKYDLIISIQTMTDAAVTSGAMTLSESYLLTKEAFEDFIDHLTPDGTILMTRPPQQISKIFATIREAFEAKNLGSPASRLIAFTGPLAPYGHRLFNTGFLFKKSPWTADEIGTVVQRLGVGAPDLWFGLSPTISYAPANAASVGNSTYASELVEILSAPNLHDVYAAHREALAPATDDRPYFNQNVKLSSLRPMDFRLIFQAGDQGSVLSQPVAEIMLAVVLIQAAITAFFLIMLPLMRFARGGLSEAKPWRFLAYFAALGIGFIMIEIVLIQKFSLFIGQPVYTVAIVLASLLIFTGGGSALVGRLDNARGKALNWIVTGIVAYLLVIATSSSWIFAEALGLSLFWRTVISVAMLAPLGTLLGMPFPIGLQIVGEDAPALVPWAWGVNGFLTVIGSIGAAILGMAFGFTVVLAISAACYLAALLVMTVKRGHAQELAPVAAPPRRHGPSLPLHPAGGRTAAQKRSLGKI